MGCLGVWRPRTNKVLPAHTAFSAGEEDEGASVLMKVNVSCGRMETCADFTAAMAPGVSFRHVPAAPRTNRK